MNEKKTELSVRRGYEKPELTVDEMVLDDVIVTSNETETMPVETKAP